MSLHGAAAAASSSVSDAWEHATIFFLRPLLAISFVLALILLSWFVAWRTVLVHVPLVQEIFGLRKKTVKPKPPNRHRLSKFYYSDAPERSSRFEVQKESRAKRRKCKVGLINSTDGLSGPDVSGAILLGDDQPQSAEKRAQQIEQRRKQSAVGTPDYLAPEILLGMSHGLSLYFCKYLWSLETPPMFYSRSQARIKEEDCVRPRQPT